MTKENCDCGCCDPVADTPEEMLRFLKSRFEYAGVSDAVATQYAKDIGMILDKFYPSVAKMIRAPMPILAKHTSVFMAGSIEMGTAEPWQERLFEATKDLHLEYWNPRRDDWDASWEQSISNPQFNEQVNWELAGLNSADYVVFYFDPNTKSPITLLELGLVAGTRACDEIVVCCPPGFYRKGNVDILCENYNICVVESFDALVSHVKEYFV